MIRKHPDQLYRIDSKKLIGGLTLVENIDSGTEETEDTEETKLDTIKDTFTSLPELELVTEEQKTFIDKLVLSDVTFSDLFDTSKYSDDNFRATGRERAYGGKILDLSRDEYNFFGDTSTESGIGPLGHTNSLIPSIHSDSRYSRLYNIDNTRLFTDLRYNAQRAEASVDISLEEDVIDDFI